MAKNQNMVVIPATGPHQTMKKMKIQCAASAKSCALNIFTIASRNARPVNRHSVRIVNQVHQSQIPPSASTARMSACIRNLQLYALRGDRHEKITNEWQTTWRNNMVPMKRFTQK